MVNFKFCAQNKGFSLLELLLSISVIVGLLTFVTIIFNDWFKDSIDRRVARETQQLQNAAKSYVEFNLNTLISSDIPAIGNIVEIDITDLTAGGFLPVGYNATNSYRQGYRVFARKLAEDTIDGQISNIVEIISLSTGNRMANSRIVKAVSNADPSLGIISDLDISPTCCNGNAQSLNGTWSIPLNATYFGPAISATLPSPNASGGYIAAYDIVSNNDLLLSNYLFRDRVIANPDLNKMETSLILNNTDIVNAGYIVSDSMNIAGAATFDGLEPDGATQSPYVLAVRDDFTVGNNINVTDGGNPLRGNVTIEGDDGIGVDFTVTGTMTVNNNTTSLAGNVSSSTLRTDNISIAGNAQFGNLDNGGSSLMAGSISSNNNISFTDTVTTDSLQIIRSDSVNEIRSDSAAVGTIEVTNSANLNLPANVILDIGKGITAPDINVDNVNITQDLNITTLSNCTNGCPP